MHSRPWADDEENLRRAMKISFGDQMLLITRPILRRLPVRRRRVARR
jgi:TctA family transporter